MERQVLGEKVKGFTGGIKAGVIIFSVLWIQSLILLFIADDFNYFLLIGTLTYPIGIILMSRILVKVLRQPQIILECDEENLYFNEYQKTTIIPLKEIREVRAFQHYDRYHNYEFGDIIIIKISNLKITIGKIYYVEEVKDKILELMNKSK